MLRSLSEYPHGFVVACTVCAGLLVVWMLVKLLKLALWMLFFAFLALLAATAVWLLLT